jgi:hypothetical protein
MNDQTTKKTPTKEEPLVAMGRKEKYPEDVLRRIREMLSAERAITLRPLIEPVSERFICDPALVQFLIQIKPREDDVPERIDAQMPWQKFAAAYHRFYVDYGVCYCLDHFNEPGYAVLKLHVTQLKLFVPYLVDHVAVDAPRCFGQKSFYDQEKFIAAIACYLNASDCKFATIRAAEAKMRRDWAKRFKKPGKNTWPELFEAMISVLELYRRAADLPEGSNYQQIESAYLRRDSATVAAWQ